MSAFLLVPLVWIGGSVVLFAALWLAQEQQRRHRLKRRPRGVVIDLTRRRDL